jgi:hypothetical protein
VRLESSSKTGCQKGATTLRIMTLSITTLRKAIFSIKFLYVTLSINDTKHNNDLVLRLISDLLGVTFYLLLC